MPPGGALSLRATVSTSFLAREGAHTMTTEHTILTGLIDRLEGPLPLERQRLEEVWVLYLSQDERSAVLDALYQARIKAIP